MYFLEKLSLATLQILGSSQEAEQQCSNVAENMCFGIDLGSGIYLL